MIKALIKDQNYKVTVVGSGCLGLLLSALLAHYNNTSALNIGSYRECCVQILLVQTNEALMRVGGPVRLRRGQILNNGNAGWLWLKQQ